LNIITRLNRIASQSKHPRLWGSFSEILWFEEIGIWTVDLKALAYSPVIDSIVTIPGVEYRFAGEEILDQLLEDKELAFSAKETIFYRESLRKGDKLFVAIVDGQVVFHGMIAIGFKRVYSQYFSLLNHECFARSFFTHPCFRGKCICPQAIQIASKQLVCEGYAVMYLDVATQNEPSLRACRKIGAAHSGSRYFRIRTFGRDWIVSLGTLHNRFMKRPPSQGSLDRTARIVLPS